MTLHAQLLRIEYRVCLVALLIYGLTLTTSLVVELDSGRISRVHEIGSFCLWLTAVFGIGPAHEVFAQAGRDEQAPGRRARLLLRLRPFGHLCAALFFFVLFCTAAFVSSESRALLLVSEELRLPIWLLQSPAVIAFAMNVVRHSVLAVDDPMRRESV